MNIEYFQKPSSRHDVDKTKIVSPLNKNPIQRQIEQTFKLSQRKLLLITVLTIKLFLMKIRNWT
jgi:hypothetical protein